MLANINICENGWSNFSENLRFVAIKLLEITQNAFPDPYNFSAFGVHCDVDIFWGVKLHFFMSFSLKVAQRWEVELDLKWNVDLMFKLRSIGVGGGVFSIFRGFSA